MRTQLFLSLVAVAAVTVAGCGKSSGHNGDGGAPADMVDVPPVPTATHVGAVGNSCCMESDATATHAAYLLNLKPVNGTVEGIPLGVIGLFGELHVASSTGADVMVAASVEQGDYVLSPDGKSLFYGGFDTTTGITTGIHSLNRFDTTTGKSTVLSPSGLPTQLLGQTMDKTNVFVPIPFGDNVFFTSSGKYFVLGVLAANALTDGDLWIIDVATGATVLTRADGEYGAYQIVTGDDTLIFEDTVGGTVTGTGATGPSNPLQTVYWQPISAGSTASVITTRASIFNTTADGSNLVILHVNGDVDVWDMKKHTLSAAPIITGAVSVSFGSKGTGPIAWVGADNSVHVTDTTGAKLLDIAGSVASASLDGQAIISPDNEHLYFWQAMEPQASRGNLMHVAIKSGATPTKLAAEVSSQDLIFTDSSLVFLQNVDQPGQIGDVATANFDGTGLIALDTKANVGGLRVVNPLAKTWNAAHLSAAAADTDVSHTLLVGSAVTGALTLGGTSPTAAPSETVIDPTVGASQYELSDDGHDVIYIAGVNWNSAAQNYVGALEIVDIKAPGTKIIGGVVGVAELGPVFNRAFFVSAPLAAMAGIYYVKY